MWCDVHEIKKWLKIWKNGLKILFMMLTKYYLKNFDMTAVCIWREDRNTARYDPCVYEENNLNYSISRKNRDKIGSTYDSMSTEYPKEKLLYLNGQHDMQVIGGGSTSKGLREPCRHDTFG